MDNYVIASQSVRFEVGFDVSNCKRAGQWQVAACPRLGQCYHS